MASISWKNPISGDFSTAADWTGGVVPGSADNALLTVAGSAYTVTFSTNPTVNSLQLASNATASVSASTSLTLTNGTGSGADAGQILVGNNDTLYIGGTFNNTSTIATGGLVLNGAANTTNLQILSATTTFTGGGSVVMGTAGNNQIYGNGGSADTLVNVNNKFTGVGNLGAADMTFVNQAAGVVNANQTGVLELDVNGGVTNTGLLEATNTGGLLIASTGINNVGGHITATGSGAQVDLQNATITGGTLTAGSGAQIAVTGSQTAYVNGSGAGNTVTITSGTNVNVTNNTYLYLAGAIANSGVINLQGAANSTELRLRTATTTLTGGGQLVMSGTTANDYIIGDAGDANTLINTNNTISGGGNLGGGDLTFVNQTAGVVNANQTAAMTLDVNGGVLNTGLLESTNTGGLLIASTSVDDTGGSNAGKISAAASGAHVDLENTTITGGTLSSVSGAQIDVVSGESAYLDGSQPGAPITLTSGSNFNVNNNSSVYLYGSIVNQGVISLLGVANVAYMRLVTAVTTFNGGGQIVLGSGGNNYIFGNGGALNELDNVNNTISGAGNVGDGQMTLVNEAAGVVNANQAVALTLQVNGGVTNTGLLEDTGSGGLSIYDTTVDNTGKGDSGKITASGASAHVDLQSSTIVGGALTSTGTGAEFDIVSGQTATLDGSHSAAPVKIAAGTNFLINNNSTLYLRGVINNSGTITVGVDGDANTTSIRLNSATVTLQGGGFINLGNSANNYIYANDNASETLSNIDNTIEGSGNIGDGQMTIYNYKAGVIDADQAPGLTGTGDVGQLYLQAGQVTNQGTIEATVGAGAAVGGDLIIYNTNILEYSTGTVDAIGSSTLASTVELRNSTIGGGTLVSSGGPSSGASAFQVDSGYSATVDGSTFNIGVNAVMNVQNNATLYLKGNVNVSKTINLLAAGNGTDISIASSAVTLTGAGVINLGNNANNYITSNDGIQSLYNFDDVFQGAGDIGNGSALQFVNETRGVINANQTTALILQETQTVQNYGLIESNTGVSGAGGLEVLNTNIDDTVANANGVLNTGKITAAGTGHVDLQNTNIYGGTLTSTGAAYIDVISGQAAGLNGTVSGQAVTITAGTNFDVNNNSTLYLYGAIINAGTINLTSAANNSNIYLNSPVVTLSGGGQVVLGGTNTDYIVQNQGNAQLNNVDNTISGAGFIGNGGALYLTNGAAGSINATGASGFAINLGGVQMINAGTLLATGGAITVTNSVYNTGRIIADGANVKIGGNVNGAGVDLISGASTLEIGSSVGGAAAQAVTFAEAGTGSSTGTFKIDSAQSFTGTVTDFGTGDTLDLGNVAFASATLSYTGNTSGGVLTVTDGTTTANISLVGNYTQSHFTLTADANNDTDVTYTGAQGAPVVVDTAANLSNATLNTLKANTAVTSILVSDSGLSTGGYIQATVAELTADASVFSEMTNANGKPIQVQVADTAINLSNAGLDTIEANALVTSVVVTDNGSSNGGRVEATVAQLTSDAKVLSELVFASGQTTSTVRINDTAAHVTAALDTINADHQIGRLYIKDNLPITVSVAQLTSDATAIGYSRNYNGSNTVLYVSDTAANVSGAELNALQADSLIGKVTVSDNGASNGGYVGANVAQLTSDSGILGKLVFANAQTKTLNVTDTAANISGDIGSLNSDAQIGQLTISDNGIISLSAGNYNGDTAATGELKNANASAVVFDVADSSVDLNGVSFHGLTTAGDAIDAVDVKFAQLSTATFTENAAHTSGVLTLSDGTHSAAITLFGQYAAAGFSGQATAAGFSVALDGSTGTKVTLLATVPA